MLTIRTAQLDILPGNIRANWALIEKEIALAKEEGSDLLVLPEMCLTGYLIGDLWDQNAFLRETERYNDRLREAAQGIMIAWGNVAIDWTKTNDDGRPRKYNAAFLAKDGAFLSPEGLHRPYAVKALLPNYRCFDDRRYFTSLLALAREEGSTHGCPCRQGQRSFPESVRLSLHAFQK